MAAHGADIILLNLVEGAWSPPSIWSFPSLGRMADLRELAATIGRHIQASVGSAIATTPPIHQRSDQAIASRSPFVWGSGALSPSRSSRARSPSSPVAIAR